MLRTSFEECRASPESFAFLCDELARSIRAAHVSKWAAGRGGTVHIWAGRWHLVLAFRLGLCMGFAQCACLLAQPL